MLDGGCGLSSLLEIADCRGPKNREKVERNEQDSIGYSFTGFLDERGLPLNVFFARNDAGELFKLECFRISNEGTAAIR